MRRLLAAALSLFASTTALAGPRVDEDAGIRALIEDFRTAIIEKDRQKFLGLFLDGPVAWQSVSSDASLAQARQEDPAAQKAAFDPKQTPAGFIEMIARDAKANEETFVNVAIDSDGDAASVAFDFSYVRDGRTINVGREYWLLVRSNAGWKIVAVTWSRNTPAPGP